MLNAILIGLSLLGLFISSYFTAVAYRWIRPDTRWVPAFCRMGEKTCASIVHTPRARVFGVPNSLLGQFFYAALLIGALSGILFEAPFYQLFLGAAAVTVVLAVYLSYSLLFITRVPCPLCFTSHALNVVIFILLLT